MTVQGMSNGGLAFSESSPDSYNPWATIKDIYSSGNALTQQTTTNTSGSYSLESFDATGGIWANETKSYTAGGALTSDLTMDNNGAGALNTYNSQGAIIQTKTINADGSYGLLSFGLGAQSYASILDTYASSAAGGGLTQATVNNAAGGGFNVNLNSRVFPMPPEPLARATRECIFFQFTHENGDCARERDGVWR